MLTCTRCAQTVDLNLHDGEPCVQAMCPGILREEPPIATQVMQWLQDLWLIETTMEATVLLVNCYNWATSPGRLMTDREHQACSRLARRCRDRLTGRLGWHESDDGRLWC